MAKFQVVMQLCAPPWSSDGVRKDVRWSELREFCRGAAEQGRSRAVAGLKRAIDVEDDELAPTKRAALGDGPRVEVVRLRASAGRFTWESIREHIDSADVLMFDVTPTKKDREGRLSVTPNVWLEIGYALAAPGRSVFLVHAAEKGYEDIPSDLRGLIVGHLPTGRDRGHDLSLRAALAGEVCRLVRSRIE